MGCPCKLETIRGNSYGWSRLYGRSEIPRLHKLGTGMTMPNFVLRSLVIARPADLDTYEFV